MDIAMPELTPEIEALIKKRVHEEVEQALAHVDRRIETAIQAWAEKLVRELGVQAGPRRRPFEYKAGER